MHWCSGGSCVGTIVINGYQIGRRHCNDLLDMANLIVIVFQWKWRITTVIKM